MKITFKQFLNEIVDVSELKRYMQAKKPLSDQEYQQVMNARAIWVKSGQEVPAIWKSVDRSGKDVYITSSDRAYRVEPTLQGAIKQFQTYISKTGVSA